MNLTDKRTLHSSDKCEVVIGEFEGKQYIEKTGEFSREVISAISSVNSPRVAKVYEIGENSVIMEYADGFPLSEKKIPERNVYDIALELCDALAALHEKGVIHRDVKPSNIILCADGHIKLIDFDAARLKKPKLDKDTRFMGTDGFAPPEQYGFMQTDERSDIYAFGVTIKLLLDDVFSHSPYKNVIERCTRFNPDECYKSIKAVKNALRLRRIMPFVFAAMGISAAFAAAFVLMNFLNGKPTASGDYINSGSEYSDYGTSGSMSQSVQNSSSFVLSTSEQTSSKQSSSASSASASTFSSSSFSASSTSASSSSSSSFSASSTSASISSSSSFYASSTSSHSSSNLSSSKSSSSTSSSKTSSSSQTLIPTPITPPNEPVKTAIEYPVSWDWLTLPEGFPKLTEAVSFYDVSPFQRADLYDYHYIFSWDGMNRSELNEIALKAWTWLGDDAHVSESIRDGGKLNWEMRGTDYRIDIYESTADDSVVFHIYTMIDNYKPPLLNLSIADPAISPNSDRPLKWEDTTIPYYIPKLTDYVQSFFINRNSYEPMWYNMCIEETESIVQKIIDWFDGDYGYHHQFDDDGALWVLYGEVNGIEQTVEIRYFETQDFEGNDRTVTTAAFIF